MGVREEKETGPVSVKVASEELDRILETRRNPDVAKAMAICGTRYANLGWQPVALEGPRGSWAWIFPIPRPLAFCWIWP